MGTIGDSTLTRTVSAIEWPSVIAGAAVAAGAGITLNAFGVGIGLSLASTAPTWRDSFAFYWFLGGAFLLFVSIVSFSLGGYIAGRMRTRVRESLSETELDDGIHGLVTWGLAVLLAALLAVGVAATTSPAPASTNASASVGETILATELDELFRTDRAVDDLAYRRSEASRILLKAASHTGVLNDDRRYLTAITASILGVPEAEAKSRVDHAVVAARDALHRARVAAVLQAFFVAASLFVGACLAWFAANEGGKDRHHGTYQFWEWRRRP